MPFRSWQTFLRLMCGSGSWESEGRLTSEDVPLEMFVPGEGLAAVGTEYHCGGIIYEGKERVAGLNEGTQEMYRQLSECLANSHSQVQQWFSVSGGGIRVDIWGFVDINE